MTPHPTNNSERTERFTFGVHSLDILERHKKTLEDFGYTCTVEVSHVGRHELHTLVAVRPKAGKL
jgi:hypothetical protein